MALTLSSAKKTEKAVDGVTKSVADTKQDKKEEENRKLLKDILQSDGSRKAATTNAELNEKRIVDTGDWILQEPFFQGWLNQDTLLLWILGGPSSGKSYLSSRIVRHLHDLYPQEKQLPKPISVGFFYIKEDDQQLRDINIALKAVASQIAKNDLVYRNHAVNVCTSAEELLTAKGTWKKLFLDYFSSQQNDSLAFIVIDGVDEAPREQRLTLLELLANLQEMPGSETQPRIQIALIGRHEIHKDVHTVYPDRISRIRQEYIEINSKKNGADIHRSIHNGIKKIAILRKLPSKQRSELRSFIISRLTEGANGMFLWVNLMINEIAGKSRETEIRAKLQDAPKNLTKMIRHVFERLAADEDINKEDLNEILTWVAYAERPLYLGEIGLTLMLLSPTGEGSHLLEDDLRGRLASLFTLRREDGLSTEDLQRRSQREQSALLEHGAKYEEGASDDELSDDETTEPDPFGSNPDSTTVEFSHASIRDFLRQEGLLADIGIGVEKADAQEHITVTCMSIICNSGHITKYPSANLADYAAGHFIRHLASIDPAKVSLGVKRTIVKDLASIFCNEVTMARWWSAMSDNDMEHFIQACIASTPCSASIQSFLKDASCYEGLSPEDRTWAQVATSSAKELFRPLAMYLASAWLRDNEVDPDRCVQFLHYYALLDTQGEAKSKSPVSEDQILVAVSRLSPAQIRTAAKVAEFEETYYWHARVAKALRDAGHVDDAIAEFMLSIEMNDKHSSAWAGLSYAYERAERDDLATAIQCMHKAIEHLPTGDAEIGEFWEQVSYWKTDLGDVEGAVQASGEATLAEPDNLSFVASYIRSLHAASQAERIIDKAKELNAQKSPSGEHTLLVDLLLKEGVNDPFANAAKCTNEIDFAIESMKAAIETAQRSNNSLDLYIERIALARLYHNHTADEDIAIALYEELMVDLEDKTKEDWARTWARAQVCDTLDRMYFSKAMTAERGGQDPTPWVLKLEKLSRESKGIQSDGEDEDEYSTREATLLLGVWNRLHNQAEEARACFQAQIMKGIAILTDDDPNNDLDGYTKLAQTLLMAGKRADAAAAFALVVAPLDELKASRKSKGLAREREHKQLSNLMQFGKLMGNASVESESIDKSLASIALSSPVPATNEGSAEAKADRAAEDDSKDNVVTFPWSCDGLCRRKQEDWTAFYFCEYCYNVCFCDRCIELLRAGKLSRCSVCGTDHPLLQVYPTDHSAGDVAAVKVDETVLPRKEWLDALKLEWSS